MDYLIAYDICDPKRLRQVARLLERRAVRCQKSVFRFRGPPSELKALLDASAALIQASEDIVQAWALGHPPDQVGLARGAIVRIAPAGVVIGGSGMVFIPSSSDGFDN